MNWDTIFTTGTHTDSNGKTRTWTQDDFDALVKNTGENIPVVIRHPETEDSVTHFGKIARLRRVGDELIHNNHSVPDVLKNAVKEGLSQGKSVFIDTGKTLRHLGPRARMGTTLGNSGFIVCLVTVSIHVPVWARPTPPIQARAAWPCFNPRARMGTTDRNRLAWP